MDVQSNYNSMCILSFARAMDKFSEKSVHKANANPESAQVQQFISSRKPNLFLCMMAKSLKSCYTFPVTNGCHTRKRDDTKNIVICVTRQYKMSSAWCIPSSEGSPTCLPRVIDIAVWKKFAWKNFHFKSTKWLKIVWHPQNTQVSRKWRWRRDSMRRGHSLVSRPQSVDTLHLNSKWRSPLFSFSRISWTKSVRRCGRRRMYCRAFHRHQWIPHDEAVASKNRRNRLWSPHLQQLHVRLTTLPRWR